MPDEKILAQLVADLGAECIKLDGKLDQFGEAVTAELRDLQRKYRTLFDAMADLRSKVLRLENQR